MSLHNVAQHLAEQGTGTDTQLVHMSPKEVQSLQALAQKHGGSLTINPTTGLPQAGFLDAVLPAVAGIGLNILSGGALTPLMSGLIVGGADYALTGSLSKGLAAGLGAFGGAGLGESISGLGGAAGATGVANTATPTVDAYNTAASEAALPGAPSSSNFGSGIAKLTSNPVQSFNQMGGLGGVGMNAAMAASPLLSASSQNLLGKDSVPSTDSSDAMITPYTFSQTPTGAFSSQRQFNTSFTPQPPVSASGFKGFADGGSVPQNYATGQLSAPSQAVQDFNNALMAQAKTAYANGINYAGNARNIPAPVTTSPVTTSPVTTSPVTTAPVTSDVPANYVDTPRAFANYGESDGGGVYTPRAFANYGEGNGAASGGVVKTYAMGGGIGQRYPAPDDEDMPQGAANGGIMGAHSLTNPDAPTYPMQGTIGSYSDGGQLLKGPGTGQSDDIPATIGGKQPARLANEEFVIPADVVSMLGDGSSEAGAKRLYAMLDRVRKAAHGKTTQQKKIDPKKVLPA
jgi:hypothetical protein